MKRAVLLALSLLIIPAAFAEEMTPPHISVAPPDWNAALTALPGAAPGLANEALHRLNAAAAHRFSGIEASTVPVLLPFDADGFAKAVATGGPNEQATAADPFVLAGFHATRFFVAGPAGYDAAFSLRTEEVPELADIAYRDTVYVLFSGLRMTYDLDGPPLPAGEPVKELEGQYPGIRRTLHESYVRYSFDQYGVTYVAAIYCLDTRPRAKILSCHQADQIATRFLRALKLSGGTPAPQPAEVVPVAIDEPAAVSPDFTYYGPGNLLPGTGLKKELPGRVDYTVYAHLRFPMKEAPAFANSQSFNNWGNCDFTGRSGRLGQKDAPYSCKVNERPLVFDEAAGTNYSYPWRDNFCEHRYFFVGQCPGGEGHQGQDIRPGFCKLSNSGADRCEPYQHDVVAVHDGVILRARKQEAVYLFINTPDTHMRVRYMHMNPQQLDADGIVSGKQVHEGDLLGKVGNYDEHEHGTTYHLHFDMQVPTKIGWVFVSPYMTLVTAYERLIGARGTKIESDNADPPIAAVPPVIDHEEPAPSVNAALSESPARHKRTARPRHTKAAHSKHKKRRRVASSRRDD